MSFNLGWECFLKRFQERFPEPEYSWEGESSSNGSDKFEEVSFVIKKGDIVICKIHAKLGFGIYLVVESAYLNESEYAYNGIETRVISARPRTVGFCNQHRMRGYLNRKPKFGMLASKWSCQIFHNFRFIQAGLNVLEENRNAG